MMVIIPSVWYTITRLTEFVLQILTYLAQSNYISPKNPLYRIYTFVTMEFTIVYIGSNLFVYIIFNKVFKQHFIEQFASLLPTLIKEKLNQIAKQADQSSLSNKETYK
jgi:hypothetical protein